MLPPKVFVQRVEHGPAAREALLVVAMRRRYTRDQGVDASELLASELRVLQIDVMNDLRERTERGVVEPETRDEDLERAAVTIVRELGLEHVEADLTAFGTVTAGRHELELGAGIDEPPNQPGARDTVDVNALPRDPCPAAILFRARVVRHGRPPYVTLEFADHSLGDLAAGRAEEVDLADRLQAPAKPLELHVARERALGRRPVLCDRARLVRDLAVVGLACGV